MNIIGWLLAAAAFVNVSTGFRIPSFTARIRSLALTSNEKVAKKDSPLVPPLRLFSCFDPHRPYQLSYLLRIT
jgi:hypothetical protein